MQLQHKEETKRRKRIMQNESQFNWRVDGSLANYKFKFAQQNILFIIFVGFLGNIL
jgi:hypothetical protein